MDPHSCASSHYHRTTAKHLLNMEYYTKFSDIPPVGGDWWDKGDKWGQWLCPLPVLSMESSFCSMDFHNSPCSLPKGAPARAGGGHIAPNHCLPPPLESGELHAQSLEGFSRDLGNMSSKNLIPGKIWEEQGSSFIMNLRKAEWHCPGLTHQTKPHLEALNVLIIYYMLGQVRYSSQRWSFLKT